MYNLTQTSGGTCVIKSQILKGGRGKGTFDSGLRGGIQNVDNPGTGMQIASQMLGHRLKTKQTPGQGLKVNKLYVVETVRYDEEYYLAMTIDRENYTPTIIISKSGGIDIETVAKECPEKLSTFPFTLTKGITPELLEQISTRLCLSADEARNLSQILSRIYRLFVSKDATLLEINPLARFSDGTFICLDAKFTFDNAAQKRQEDLFAQRDAQHEVSDELEASQHGLVYVRMDGIVGNVVNGAGLAMATNDAIAYYGGESANFMDTGGQATKETMLKAFEIITRDDRVKVILVNIYGGEIFRWSKRPSNYVLVDLPTGIIKCDMIAESIIAAASELGPSRVPIVVRLQGTNSNEGLALVRQPTPLYPMYPMHSN